MNRILYWGAGALVCAEAASAAPNAADHDGSIDVAIPVKAGSHMVGVTFRATNYGPSLDPTKSSNAWSSG